MPPSFPSFHAWRDAEQAAQAAKRELYVLMAESGVHRDAQRLTDQAASAQLLSRRAHELFGEAMREMKVVAESLHHRQLGGHGRDRPMRSIEPVAAGDAADARARAADR